MAQVDALTLKFAEAGPSSVAAAVAAGGSDPINKGELVLALEAGTVSLITMDANGTPRILAQGGTAPSGPGRVDATITISNPVGGAPFLAALAGVGQSGLIQSITTSAGARVVIYESTAARTADASRLPNTSPVSTSKVAAEISTSGAQSLDAPPGVTYSAADAGVGLPLRITPLASGASLTITARILVLEQ